MNQTTTITCATAIILSGVIVLAAQRQRLNQSYQVGLNNLNNIINTQSNESWEDTSYDEDVINTQPSNYSQMNYYNDDYLTLPVVKNHVACSSCKTSRSPSYVGTSSCSRSYGNCGNYSSCGRSYRSSCGGYSSCGRSYGSCGNYGGCGVFRGGLFRGGCR